MLEVRDFAFAVGGVVVGWGGGGLVVEGPATRQEKVFSPSSCE